MEPAFWGPPFLVLSVNFAPEPCADKAPDPGGGAEAAAQAAKRGDGARQGGEPGS